MSDSMDLDERRKMRDERGRPPGGSGLRKWARLYLLAGRIAAGIFQPVSGRRLPDSYAYVRAQEDEEGLISRAERIGNIILTMPLDARKSDATTKDTSTNGWRAESPLSLPRLSRHR